MRLSTPVRASSLAIFSIVSFFAALIVLGWDDSGHIDRDLLLFGAFFFFAPVMLLSGLLLVASVLAVCGKRWLFTDLAKSSARPVAGQCLHCRHDITSEDIHCPGCGRSLSGRWVAAGMMSPNAKEREHAETERIRWELRMRRHPLAVAAARSLVHLSTPPKGDMSETAETVELCLTNPPLVQKLYRSAARRLHPDHNDGEHLPKWFELQEAMRTLQSFHELAEDVKNDV
jgi:hypothetical protein